MDAAELQWWSVADDMGLVFDPRLAVAQLRATAMNAAGAKPASRPSDFLPPAPRPMQTPAEQQALVRAAAPRVRKA